MVGQSGDHYAMRAADACGRRKRRTKGQNRVISEIWSWDGVLKAIVKRGFVKRALLMNPLVTILFTTRPMVEKIDDPGLDSLGRRQVASLAG